MRNIREMTSAWIIDAEGPSDARETEDEMEGPTAEAITERGKRKETLEGIIDPSVARMLWNSGASGKGDDRRYTLETVKR